MKRSEMSKHIQHFLESYRKEPGLFGRKNEQANELLDLIEQLGMKPPTTWHSDCIGDYTEGEWESEDEKK